MRPEVYEYNFDWMLWRTLEAASKVGDGFDKEFKHMLPYIPYFRGIVEPFINLGEPGNAFFKMLSKYLKNIVTAHEQGKKIVMTTFCFSPTIFYAMDIVPVTLEALTVLASVMWKRGATEYMDFCVELGFTETSCSSQRGTLGAYLAGLGEEIDMLVINTAGICDTNANAFSFAKTFLDKPFYSLNYPASLNDPEVNQYHRDDFKALIQFLENQTGKRLDQDRLGKVLDEIARQETIVGEMEELQRLVPSPLPVTYNFLIYGGRFFFAGMPEYTEILETMVKVVRKNAAQGQSGISSGKEKLRAFMFYIDHYALNLSLWNWFDKREINHIGSLLSRSFKNDSPYVKGMEDVAYNIDSTNLDTMIDSIAMLNSRMPMVRSVRGPYDRPHMWLEESLALAKMYKADCLIYNGTPGCRNTWSNVKLIAKDLEKAGYPTHIMYGDAFDDRVESWEATAARLDEFLNVRGLL
ncbi:MAG: 2-hydroxyacyl-CoA dehydratase [Desulfobacterium sp.]|nr:2-hydroxyacyl-CoA dehydratase [Desulfobacterium sp.]